MKILLLGYGKMGKLIEELAKKEGHQIIGQITSNNTAQLNTLNPIEIDVAIDFSSPESVIDNVKWCIDMKIPAVVGTTGWTNRKNELDEYCTKNQGTYLFSSNFSIGVNLFFQLNSVLAKLMNLQLSYDPSILEIHHTQKLDSPSGTAITLANQIIQEIDRKSRWMNGDKTDSADTLMVKSERIDPAPGTHLVKYTSEIDTIELKHTAHSRLGFAQGALSVAEWIQGKQGVMAMEDFLSSKQKNAF